MGKSKDILTETTGHPVIEGSELICSWKNNATSKFLFVFRNGTKKLYVCVWDGFSADFSDVGIHYDLS